MSAIETSRGTHAPGDAWPGGTIPGFEWPVRWAYKITFGDGSVAYYPSWECIPNRILKMQSDGYYEDATVTVVSWDTEGV